jgi:tRNA pseudouridine65 synthase
LRHLSWPIIGDTKHGDGTHNQLWRDNMSITRLLLHASQLKIKHPSGEILTLTAALPPEMTAALALTGWNNATEFNG